MPALGAGMEAGRVLEWHVGVGQVVQRGDIIALVETDKANIEVEVFESGIVEELLVPEGTKVPVGTPMARIGSTTAGPADTAPPAAAIEIRPPAGEPGPPPTVVEPAPAAGAPSAAARAEHSARPVVRSPLVRRLAAMYGLDLATIPGTGPNGLITRRDVEEAAGAAIPVRGGGRASPYARRLADERGVDLATVAGSGAGGVVVAEDVLRQRPEPVRAPRIPEPTSSPARAEGAPTAPEQGGTPPAADAVADRRAAMRLAIARAMARSNQEIPHYHLGEHVDMETTLQWLEVRNEDLPAAKRVLPAALVLRATALACRAYPEFSGFWVGDTFEAADGVHLGVAISLRGGGLLAPAIHDADELSVAELMDALRDLVQRTRSGGLRGSELTDASITVTNLGDTGVESVHGVIYPPQVALVGAGKIASRPWTTDGMVGARRVLHLTLAADHRASDGHRGGLFLADIAARLTEPETL